MSDTTSSYAFLSSPVKGLDDIRRAVHDLALPDKGTIWVDELDHPGADDPSFITVDRLFSLIRKASIFIILLGSDRHGTQLSIGGQKAHVTYWEAELFYAVLVGKPVRVFEIEGFKPIGKLEAGLRMLRNALPRGA